MSKLAVAYVRYMDSMSTRLGKILKFGILALIGIMLIEVVARYIFNKPTPWAVELSMFIIGTYWVLAGSYVLLRGAHVRMDALYSRWSPRKRAIFDAATVFLVGVYLITFIRGGLPSVVFSLQHGQHTTTQWGPPLAPIKIVLIAGGTLLFLQAIAIFIKDLAIIRGRDI